MDMNTHEIDITLMEACQPPVTIRASHKANGDVSIEILADEPASMTVDVDLACHVFEALHWVIHCDNIKLFRPVATSLVEREISAALASGEPLLPEEIAERIVRPVGLVKTLLKEMALAGRIKNRRIVTYEVCDEESS